MKYILSIICICLLALHLILFFCKDIPEPTKQPSYTLSRTILNDLKSSFSVTINNTSYYSNGILFHLQSKADLFPFIHFLEEHSFYPLSLSIHSDGEHQIVSGNFFIKEVDL
ncbi:hypothetical protein ACFL56_01655 [Candidatus Margulisiibacteriota bacterium]